MLLVVQGKKRGAPVNQDYTPAPSVGVASSGEGVATLHRQPPLSLNRSRDYNTVVDFMQSKCD